MIAIFGQLLGSYSKIYPSNISSAGGSSLLTNLISFWKLDETSGNRADAQGTNTLTDHGSTPSGTGKIVNAASFTPSTQWLDHVSNSGLQTGNIDYMIWCWVNTSVSNRQFFMAKAKSDATMVEYGLELNSSADRFRYWHDTNFVDANNFGSVTSNGLGSYHLLVGWHDSVANTINIKIDNGTTDSTSYTGGTAATDGFAIGRLGDFDGLYTSGLVDEAGFRKQVPTAGELTTLWNGGAGTAYPFS